VSCCPPAPVLDEHSSEGACIRIIGLDIHRAFAEAVAWQDGKLKRIGRIDMRRDRLEAFAATLLSTDVVVVEATGNAAAVAAVISPHVKRVVIANPKQVRVGLAPKKILLANSSCWDGSHHELGECGLPGSCERRAREPSPKPNEVHGGRRQHVLKMRLGETDIAGAPQMHDPDPAEIVPSMPARFWYSLAKSGCASRSRAAARVSCSS
jgi:hypothetical protein